MTNTLDFVTYQGGALKRGTLNSYDSMNYSYAKLADFVDAGFSRINQIFQKPFYYNGKTYVMVQLASGAIITNESLYALFEFDASSGNLVGVPISIAPTGGDSNLLPGTSVQANIIQDSNILYGVSLQHIWKIDLDTQTYTTLHTFNTSTDGNSAAAIILNGDKIYGINDAGGTNSKGTIFSYDLTANTFSIIENTPANVAYNGLVINGDLLFTVKENSTSGDTTIANLDLTSGTPTFNDLVTFSMSANGAKPGPFLSDFNGVIYGVLNEEGANGLGGLFKYDIAGNTISQVLSFTKTTGHYSFNSELLLASGTLGVNDFNDSLRRVYVYPNPSEGIFTINSDQIKSFEVYNSIGQLLLQKSNTLKVNLSRFDNGLYFLKIYGVDFETTVRVIKK